MKYRLKMYAEISRGKILKYFFLVFACRFCLNIFLFVFALKISQIKSLILDNGCYLNEIIH